MKKNVFSSVLVFALFFVMLPGKSKAQGDGPRAFLLAPRGLWGVNSKWLDLNQNLLPSGNILIKNADIKVDVFPVTLFHTFAINDRFAQVMLMVNPGTASGTVEANKTGVNAPELNASGFSDGFIGFKFGLVGAPALSISDFASYKPAFSMMGYFRLWYSGTYDAAKSLNLGTHRATFELGLPMNVPIGKNLKRPIWWETYPSIQIYTTNNDPTKVTRANKSHQLPLFILENHLTHNFTPKFWAGVDLRYQYGGTLELDDEKQDNKINILGGGLEAGYQFLPFLSLNAGYGTILKGDNEAQSDMFRLSVVFVYANMNK